MKRFGLLFCCALALTACSNSFEFTAEDELLDQNEGTLVDGGNDSGDVNDGGDASPGNDDQSAPANGDENDQPANGENGQEPTDGDNSNSGNEPDSTPEPIPDPVPDSDTGTDPATDPVTDPSEEDDLENTMPEEGTDLTDSEGDTSDPEEPVAPEVAWKHCANEKQTCAFEGDALVRYGAGEFWNYLDVAGSVLCGNDTFGDPINGTKKTCQVAEEVTLVEVQPEPENPQPEPEPEPEPEQPDQVAVPSGFSLWSDASTWGGSVPAANTKVVVAAGKKILLDQNIEVKHLQIDGELQCADKNLSISANTIMVHGNFTCGLPNKPFTKKLAITLTGNKPADLSKLGPMGDKVIGVMMGGVLNLHGEERTSWLNLDATANKDSKRIVLSDAPDWRAGDRIVVTSTTQNYKQAEIVRIQSINGRTVTLVAGLQYRHFGEMQTYSNDERSWEVDTRAEVGLLSRNIKVVGDSASTSAKYGGHIMVMANSEAYIAGIEMTRVGQYGIKGRYPFHWHLTGDVAGQYIKNSAIYDSYNRCVTVHGSHNSLVEDNVCFKHVGHGFFLEDGIETGNVFNHNLGLWTIRPPKADALITSDFETGPASQGPATYWISNGNNTFTNNVAAGSDGLGYWYDTEDKVTGPSASLPEAKNYSPRKSPFGKFKDNTVHSSKMALSICSRSSGRPGYEPAGGQGALIEDLTVYYGGIGAIWPCNQYHRFKNIKVLDTGFGTGTNSKRAAFVSAFPAFIDDSLFVSNSALAGTKPVQRAAFGIYDFGTKITDTHLVNYSVDNAESSIFVEVGGAVTFMYQSMKNVTRQNSDLYLRVNGVNSKSTTGNVIRDLDGSLSGETGRWSLVPKNDLMRDSKCMTRSSKDHGVMCPYFYGQIMIKTGSVNKLPAVSVGRTDHDKVKSYQPHEARKFYKVFVPLNQSDYHHEVDFKDAFTGSLKSLGKLTLQFDYGLSGDTTLLALKNVKSTARISKTGWTKVASLTALRSHEGRAWFKSGNTIHVKFKAAGSSKAFGGRDSVDVVF